MKKLVSLLLASVMALSLVSCGNGTSGSVSSSVSSGDGANPAPVNRTTYSIGSSGATGAQYIISAAMASEINKYSDRINISVQATTGASESVALCEAGDNGFAVGSDGTMWGYYNGQGYIPAEDKTENIIGVMALQTTCGQLIARKDAGIDSWDDLKGKRVCIGTTSNSVYSISLAILEAYGVKESDLASAEKLSQSEMCEMLTDGDLDAIFMMAAPPTSAVMNLFAAQGDYVFVGGDEDKLQSVIDNVYPFLRMYTIPAGTYTGVDYDALCLADTSTIVCNKNLPEEDVYEFCKQVWDNWDVIKEGHAALPKIDVNTFDNVSIPLHPGAEKFYGEIGILG